MFKGYFVYELYQKKEGSNRWYFKVQRILEEIPEEGLRLRMATVKHFSEVVAKATTAEPHTNPTEIGRIEYYINGNKLGYALSGCIAQSRSILNSEYMINKNDCKWRAKVDDEGPYEDMSDEEIELFMELWHGKKERETHALEYELFKEGVIGAEELAESGLGRYIDAKIEFQKQTGKYPFFLPARERCAWRNSE